MQPDPDEDVKGKSDTKQGYVGRCICAQAQTGVGAQVTGRCVADGRPRDYFDAREASLRKKADDFDASGYPRRHKGRR